MSRLGELELLVMLALLRLSDEAYGVSIRQEIERRSGHDVAIGAVYATLTRLEEKRFVSTWLSDPLPIRGGRARKHWRLTPLGDRALRARRLAHRHAPQGDPMLTQLQDDLRFSLRVALRRPWLSLTVIATMALGV